MQNAQRFVALVLVLLVHTITSVACDAPRGVWPNCRTIPGRPELDETGWYCEGIITASNCGCSNATKRASLGPMCAVTEQGAIIKFEVKYPNRVSGSITCLPVAAPSGDVNAWGDAKCSQCVSANCGEQALACWNEVTVCRCLDKCQHGWVEADWNRSLDECGCAAPGSPTYDAFQVCASAACSSTCFPPTTNEECICPAP